jgi:hypothetical protein
MNAAKKTRTWFVVAVLIDLIMANENRTKKKIETKKKEKIEIVSYKANGIGTENYRKTNEGRRWPKCKYLLIHIGEQGPEKLRMTPDNLIEAQERKPKPKDESASILNGVW